MTAHPDQIRLDGRAAIVSGGGRGIGRGIAETLAAAGAKVTVFDLDEAAATDCAAAIAAAGGTARAMQADARSDSDWARVCAETMDAFGPIRILINNAGGVFHQPFLEGKPKAWEALVRANLTSVLLGTKAAGECMRENGGGTMVNIVSIEGERAAPGFAAYAAAKAGVINFTQTMALELAPHRIRVNALAPDVCLTEGVEAVLPPGGAARLGLRVPLGRAATPADIAGAALFLVSDLAAYVTGAILAVDGGTGAAAGWYDANGTWTLGPTSES